MLLGLRSRKSRFMPAHMSFPGGGLEGVDRPGEAGAYERCATREVHEETGVRVDPDTPATNPAFLSLSPPSEVKSKTPIPTLNPRRRPGGPKVTGIRFRLRVREPGDGKPGSPWWTCSGNGCHGEGRVYWPRSCGQDPPESFCPDREPSLRLMKPTVAWPMFCAFPANRSTPGWARPAKVCSFPGEPSGMGRALACPSRNRGVVDGHRSAR